MEIDDSSEYANSSSAAAASAGSSSSSAAISKALDKSSHTITADTPLTVYEDIDADIADDDDDYNMRQLAPELGDTSMKVCRESHHKSTDCHVFT
jgi:hypothetical protein